MKIDIDTNDNVFIDHTWVCHVSQKQHGTVVNRPDGSHVTMPKNRYWLSNDDGQRKFFADLLTVIG